MDWDDPYGFLPHIQNHDLADFNLGTERRPFDKLGSFPSRKKGVDGVAFVLWAPSALSVHVTGDFNQWNPISLPMRALGSSGCREIFVPNAKVGQKYKYRVLGADGVMREKQILLDQSLNLLRAMHRLYILQISAHGVGANISSLICAPNHLRFTRCIWGRGSFRTLTIVR